MGLQVILPSYKITPDTVWVRGLATAVRSEKLPATVLHQCTSIKKQRKPQTRPLFALLVLASRSVCCCLSVAARTRAFTALTAAADRYTRAPAVA